jgi:UDP-glucose 4-epimerase
VRVLVTGASGYLGSAVVRQLLEADHHVGVLVHRAEPRHPDDVEFHHGDVLDPASLPPAVRGVDAVVHLAALTRVRESFEQPARYYRANVGGSANLLEALDGAASSRGIRPRLVLASTGSVYGTPQRQPIGEDTPPDPQNPYADSKVATERLVGWQAAQGSLAAATLRIFNIAGADHGVADPEETRIIPRVAAAALGRIPQVDVYGDGTAIRDYVHVSDVASAFTAALEYVEAGRHDVFNVGATPASVIDILRTAADITGVRVPVVHHAAHPGEAAELRADTGRIRQRLSWSPSRSGLRRIIEDQMHGAHQES